MKAKVGDRIVLAANKVSGPVRDGEVIEVPHADGSPPYRIRWSDGHTGLVFPGPDAVMHHAGEEAARAIEEGAPEPQHVKQWHVDISLIEAGDDTSATAVLFSESPEKVSARGTSHRSPEDKPVAEIGDEVAVARALRHLADSMLGTAAEDIEAVTGDEAYLRPV